MATFLEGPMKRVLIEEDGHRRVAMIDRIGDTLWVHYQGEIFSVLLNESRSRKQRGSENSDLPDVFAPMPGKITQVPVRVGQEVKPGEILIVMEAMKMEYNLKASKAGTVEAIDVKVLDQVQLGQLLVRVKVSK